MIAGLSLTPTIIGRSIVAIIPSWEEDGFFIKYSSSTFTWLNYIYNFEKFLLGNETVILFKYHTNKIGIKSINRVSDPCRFCSVLSRMSCKTRHNWRPNTKGNYEFWKPPSVVLIYNKGRKIYEGSVAK